MTGKLKVGTVLFGSGLFILGLYILRQSFHWGTYGPEGPGPGFFPLIYGLIFLIFSAVLVIQTALTPVIAVEPKPEDAEERAGLRAAIVAWVALMASVPLMAWLGFIVGFGLALFFLILVVFRRSIFSSAIVAALIVLGLYFGFDVLMGLPLPTSKYWSF